MEKNEKTGTKINSLKVEVYDLIEKIEKHQLYINQLVKVKNSKVKEIAKLKESLKE